MKLHEYIKEIFDKSDLSQEEFGRKIDISGIYVGKIIKGKGNPSIPRIKRIVEAFPEYANYEKLLYLYTKKIVPEYIELVDKKLRTVDSFYKRKGLSQSEQKLLNKFNSASMTIKNAISTLLGFKHEEENQEDASKQKDSAI